MTKLVDLDQPMKITSEISYEVLVYLDDVLLSFITSADEEKNTVVQSIAIDGRLIQITRKGAVKILVNGVRVAKIYVTASTF